MPVPRFFEAWEFACRCGCGADQISAALVARLEAARALWGSPIYVTSGRRCAAHNASPDVKGAHNSRHLIGCAADLRPEAGANFNRFIAALLMFFSPPADEFIVYGEKGFVHVAVARSFEKRTGTAGISACNKVSSPARLPLERMQAPQNIAGLSSYDGRGRPLLKEVGFIFDKTHVVDVS